MKNNNFIYKKRAGGYRWPAPAKLNLFLYITGRRTDGYHLLQTLFQFLDYGDSLYITPRADNKIVLLTAVDGVPDAQNLIIRAARLLQMQPGGGSIPRGADIRIKKRLPIGGGLGGGSSNTATVLVALNALWRCGLNEIQLASLGQNLGADVPVFVHGTAAFAQGIGEKLQPVAPCEKWYLVANPGITVNTATLFADAKLQRTTPIRALTTLLATPYTNDCEPVVRKRFIEIDHLISWLQQYTPARLTGTGACVFSEFSSEQAAHQLLKRMPQGVHAFVARGINCSPLQSALAAFNKFHTV